ncbi:RNA recognition motif domain [Trinorchestia longiramus]|nr:RNA recognition motif domain [Trinorchestia longiramus]
MIMTMNCIQTVSVKNLYLIGVAEFFWKDIEMEVEIPAAAEVEASPEKVAETPADETNKENEVAEEPKKNGTLAGVAAAAAASAAKAATASAKTEEAKTPMSGIVLQFPEMFSLKRDRHILQKFEDAEDVRMQKCAFVECESEEAAVQLQAKLNNSNLNGKKVIASRLDTTEKNVLYIGSLKPETTDEMLKSFLPGVEEIKREKYNTFVLFSTETECRAARTKVIKDGINGQRMNCDFDFKGKDRFKALEEPALKKPKEDETANTENTEDKKEGEAAAAAPEEAKEESEAKGDEESDVKADEW